MALDLERLVPVETVTYSKTTEVGRKSDAYRERAFPGFVLPFKGLLYELAVDGESERACDGNESCRRKRFPEIELHW